VARSPSSAPPLRRREQSAGGVVVRRHHGRLEVAVAERVDHRTGERTRVLPKGLVDPGESPEVTARREVAEEAGLEARILEPLLDVRYVYTHPVDRARVSKRVRFYLMLHVAGEPAPRDGEMEAVAWRPLEQAERDLSYAGERRAVARARERLAAPDGPRV